VVAFVINHSFAQLRYRTNDINQWKLSAMLYGGAVIAPIIGKNCLNHDLPNSFDLSKVGE